MAFDPRGFNELAKKLQDLGGIAPEVRGRSMAGRSYYSLFLAVRTKVLAAGGRGLDSRVKHGDLSDALFSCSDPAQKDAMAALGKLLRELYECREQADYRLVLNNAHGRRVEKPTAMKSLAERTADALNRIEKLDFSGVAPHLK